MATDLAAEPVTEPKCLNDARKALMAQREKIDAKIAALGEFMSVAIDAEKIATEFGLRSPLYLESLDYLHLRCPPDKVLAILRALAKAGYHAKPGNEFQESDDKDSRWYDRGRITLFTSFGKEGRCRRVQVGTKTVEQPVYEILCDDEPTD